MKPDIHVCLTKIVKLKPCGADRKQDNTGPIFYETQAHPLVKGNAQSGVCCPNSQTTEHLTFSGKFQVMN